VNDIPAIRKAIDAVGHPALFMVDTIASLATIPFEMDAWGVDVSVTGSQKGLMTPPGLGLVAAGERAVKAHEGADLRTRYWDWTQREGPEHYQKYCGTPPEHLMFGLRKAIDMILAEGLPAVFRRHRLLAEAVRAAVEVWRQGGAVDFNIARPAERADSVTTVLMNGRDPAPLVTYLRERCGVTIGVGIGGLGGKAFRIAHMGHVNAPMILGTLGAIEMALIALNLPAGNGSGVAAAAAHLGRNVAA
jgi:alanine-glyoxylate transaminase/serine-glyoxylate transaminase/serine-pyruvate transaminase